MNAVVVSGPIHGGRVRALILGDRGTCTSLALSVYSLNVDSWSSSTSLRVLNLSLDSMLFFALSYSPMVLDGEEGNVIAFRTVSPEHMGDIELELSMPGDTELDSRCSRAWDDIRAVEGCWRENT